MIQGMEIMHRSNEIGENVGQTPSQPFSTVCQMHATIAAVEQGDAKVAFKCLHLLGDGAVRYVQLGRGCDETTVSGGHLENAK